MKQQVSPIQDLQHQAIALLQQLIKISSFSGEEHNTACAIQNWLALQNIDCERVKNNIWAKNLYFDEMKPTLLLNSHHDTVQPNQAYTRNPFQPYVHEGKLYGLGSNDAGGSLVALLSTFCYFYKQPSLKYNLIIAATGEEEISGKGGIAYLLRLLPQIEFAIVGEPTQMHLAIAEKGLLVLDACAVGIPGHAAHANTKNPIYSALEDIEWIKNYRFPKKSEMLGEVKMSVTQISAGKQHNLVPAKCKFTIDIRVNDQYQNEEIYQFIKDQLQSQVSARSLRLNSSSIDSNHPIVKAGKRLGRQVYGSPTLSDQALLNCPSLKMGPGDSKRSHAADEFIYLKEVRDAIPLYIDILKEIL